MRAVSAHAAVRNVRKDASTVSRAQLSDKRNSKNYKNSSMLLHAKLSTVLLRSCDQRHHYIVQVCNTWSRVFASTIKHPIRNTLYI
jgi:hypothetical protein